MHIDSCGQQVFTENDLCDILLKDPSKTFKNVLVEKPIHFDESLELENIPKLIHYTLENVSVDEFDKNLQSKWFMPEAYINFDIAKFVLDQCINDEELQRAGHELLMFESRNMFMLLRYLKYLVDVLKANNIVYGVGRGSSVSSFVLYKIGIHRINSLYYDLSIDEFLK